MVSSLRGEGMMMTMAMRMAVADGLAFTLSWTVMMTAMMLPSALPMIALYGAIQLGRYLGQEQRSLCPVLLELEVSSSPDSE